MALNQEQFDILITKLEKYARQQPNTYKIRVGLLAALGYLYIFFALAVLLIILVLTIWFLFYVRVFNSIILQLLVVMLVPIFAVLRSIWVKIPAPQGLKLYRRDVPNLFNIVDQLTIQLKAPRFHHILLTDEFNAAVVQVPILGLLGWQNNYLLLGLPLLQALSPTQFEAVLAHELGHLSGNHGRFGAWIYRIQKTYYQIFERLQQSGSNFGYWMIYIFFQWYAPFF